MFKLFWIKRIAYVYLLIPTVIFSIGWLNFYTAIIFSLIVIAALVSIWKREISPEVAFFGKRDWILALLMLLLWMFLSGLGGYSFQNWDHHSRNAVFRDLIDYPWPVRYHIDSDLAAHFTSASDVILSYYFGFWLPASLFGKLAGWNAANLFLFIWGLAGVALAIILSSFRIKLSLIKTTLLVTFFSGMDIVGVWLLQFVPTYSYPGIWPPIQHLEWWVGSLQYPSFTTDLFWTYNQFIPALIVMSLFVNLQNSRSAVFLVGLCFFFAPLPALGLLPFIAGKIINEFVSAWRIERTSMLIHLRKYLFTYENLAGVFIGMLSLVFYSTNLAVQSKAFGPTVPFALYMMFLMLEGFLIWFLLLPMYAKDWSWYLIGAILIIAPFVRLGDSWDFMMRTTLPSLYLLLIGCGIFLTKSKRFNIRIAFVLLLLTLGALTPIYELNRSMVRMDRYYGYHFFSPSVFERYFQNPPSTNQLFVPEFDHLDTLVADQWTSVSIPNSIGWNTKVGNLFPPAFAFLWNEDLIQK